MKILEIPFKKAAGELSEKFIPNSSFSTIQSTVTSNIPIDTG
jgi:hypothetical protein